MTTEQMIKVAERYGCRAGIAKVIIEQARRYNLPISLGFALGEQESGFRNVFGHDPTIFVGAGNVTRLKYLAYKARRKLSGNRLMQGVGVFQLTWYGYQDEADRRGGCYKTSHNASVAFEHLSSLIRQYGKVDGIARYNGSGPAAVAYSASVRQKAAKWHKRLT